MFGAMTVGKGLEVPRTVLKELISDAACHFAAKNRRFGNTTI
jgi:hypothetical protein